MTWAMMGFEAFSMALYEAPELVEALNQRLGHLVVSMFEYFAQSDAVDVIWYSDDIADASGLMVAPGVLEQYFFPWLKRIGEHARGAEAVHLSHRWCPVQCDGKNHRLRGGTPELQKAIDEAIAAFKANTLDLGDLDNMTLETTQ